MPQREMRLDDEPGSDQDTTGAIALCLCIWSRGGGVDSEDARRVRVLLTDGTRRR